MNASHNPDTQHRPKKQKTIGILGGMSDRATVEYYQLINRGVNEALGGWDIAETLIIGCNFGNIEYFVRSGQWAMAEAYLLAKAKQAQAGGADILLCMSNTMHKVLDRISEHISIPFLHIAAPTAQAIKECGLDTVALLGTHPIMSEDYMIRQYEQHGITIIVPDSKQQLDVDAIIFNELVKNTILPTSKSKYVDICDSLQQRGAQGIILGCTEIFLLINQKDLEVPVFNTTELHINAAVKWSLLNS